MSIKVRREHSLMRPLPEDTGVRERLPRGYLFSWNSLNCFFVKRRKVSSSRRHFIMHQTNCRSVSGQICLRRPFGSADETGIASRQLYSTDPKTIIQRKSVMLNYYGRTAQSKAIKLTFLVTIQAQGETHSPVTYFVNLTVVVSAAHLNRYEICL